MVGPQLRRPTDEPRPRPRPRVRGAPHDPVRDAGPRRRRRGLPAGERPARARRRPASRSGRRATSPPSARRSPPARRRARSAPVRAWDDDLDADGRRRRRAAPAPSRARPIIPGERQFRDGDRVRHARWGDGIVVTSKLTRSDEEVTVAFKDPAVGRKTMLASLANLEIVDRADRAAPEPVDRAVAGDRLAAVVRLADFEPLARERLDPAAFDYVAGGAWDELTLRDNVAAWSPLPVPPARPRRRRARSTRRRRSSGAPVALPLAIAPDGAPRAWPIRTASRDRPRRGGGRRAVHCRRCPRARSRTSPRPRPTARAGSSSTSSATAAISRDARRARRGGRLRRDRPDRRPAGARLPRRDRRRLRPPVATRTPTCRSAAVRGRATSTRCSTCAASASPGTTSPRSARGRRCRSSSRAS